ncbi:MAG: hypothetical protein MR299_04640 [Bacteroidales bacterium]|nr:hypothetical protein [Bacteroidales bacterium]
MLCKTHNRAKGNK